MLGASAGQGGGLPSSLFLNHPALLHMSQNPSAGLVSAAVAKASQPSPFPSASSISPTPCSPSPCSSPASSCSSSEMAHSPPSLGGSKIEWPRQGPIREEEEEERKREPRLSHQSYLFPSLALFFQYFFSTTALSLFLSRSFDAKNTQNERGETEGEKWKTGEWRKGKIETKNLYLSKQMERRQRGTFLSITSNVDMAPLHSCSLKENKPMTL